MDESLIVVKDETKKSCLSVRVYENGKRMLNVIWWVLFLGDMLLFAYWVVTMIIIMCIRDDLDVNYKYRIAQAILGTHTLNTLALLSVKQDHENSIYAALGIAFVFVLALDLWSLLDITLHLGHENTDIWTIMLSIAVWSISESGGSIIWFIFYYAWHRNKPIVLQNKKQQRPKTSQFNQSSSQFNQSSSQFNQSSSWQNPRTVQYLQSTPVIKTNRTRQIK